MTHPTWVAWSILITSFPRLHPRAKRVGPVFGTSILGLRLRVTSILYLMYFTRISGCLAHQRSHCQHRQRLPQPLGKPC